MDDQTLRPAVGGEDAGYLLEFLQDGVFVTVYPSDGTEMLFELSDVRQTLQDNGVIDYDVIELSKIIREAAGERRKLADEFVEVMPEEEEDVSGAQDNESAAQEEEISSEEVAGIIIDISRDQMIATVRYDTSKGTKLPTEADIKAALEEKGVVFGINEETIKKRFAVYHSQTEPLAAWFEKEGIRHTFTWEGSKDLMLANIFAFLDTLKS